MVIFSIKIMWFGTWIN